MQNKSLIRKIASVALVLGALALVSAVEALSFTIIKKPLIDDVTGSVTSDRFYRIRHGIRGRVEPVLATSLPTSSIFSNIIPQKTPSVVLINAYKDFPQVTLQYRRSAGHIIEITSSQTGTSSQKVSSGSGFFIVSNGYILTNKHVVSDPEAIYKVVVNGSSEVPAEVIYRDPNNDLAIVKIEGSGFPVIALGDSSKLHVGQQIIGIGNALGRITESVTEGTITGLNRDITVHGPDGESATLEGLVQSSERLFPGDSGGPLLNQNGEAIGINTASAIRVRREAGFSIPINAAKDTIAKAGLSL